MQTAIFILYTLEKRKVLNYCPRTLTTVGIPQDALNDCSCAGDTGPHRWTAARGTLAYIRHSAYRRCIIKLDRDSSGILTEAWNTSAHGIRACMGYPHTCARHPRGYAAAAPKARASSIG